MRSFGPMPDNARPDYNWKRRRTIAVGLEPPIAVVQWDDISSGWNIPEKKVVVTDGEYSMDFLAEDYTDAMLDAELPRMVQYALEAFARQRRLKSRVA